MNSLEGIRGPIVSKFGGGSNSTGEYIINNVEIMRSDPRRRYMIVSAPGKDPFGQAESNNPFDNQKITDVLFRCNQLVGEGKPFDQAFEAVKKRYEGIAAALQVITVDSYLNRLYKGISNGNLDWTAAQGERLLACLVSDYTGWLFRDPVDFIKLRDNGEITPMTYELIKRQLTGLAIYVIPGFYGADERGKIKIFDRGGGDITGAIIARGVNAGLYENWTHTNGFSAADPTVISNSRQVYEITRSEVRELSYRGAAVFHGDAVLPLAGTNIETHLLNSFDPQHEPTRILKERVSSVAETAIGIAGKKGFISLTIEKPGMNNQRAIGRSVFSILDDAGIAYDHDITSIDSMSVLISGEQVKDNANFQRAVEQIRCAIEPERIEVDKNLGLVCLVGQNLPNATGIKGLASTILENNGIKVIAESSPVRSKSATYAVHESKVEAAIQLLYEKLS